MSVLEYVLSVIGIGLVTLTFSTVSLTSSSIKVSQSGYFTGFIGAWVLSLYVFRPVGRWIIAKCLLISSANSTVTTRDKAKFAQVFSYLGQHILLTVSTWALARSDGWWEDEDNINIWLLGEPHVANSAYAVYFLESSGDSSFQSNALYWCYYAFIGWASVNIFMLLAYERNDSGFLLLLIHHIVTLALLTGSWFIGAPRVGVQILYVHSITDIFLDCLKLLYYLNYDYATFGVPLVEMTFASVIVTWLYYRLYVYPFLIVYPTWKHHYTHFPPLDDFHDTLWHILFVLLFVLIAFQIYWFIKLLGLAARLAQGESTKQVGSDDMKEHTN